MCVKAVCAVLRIHTYVADLLVKEWLIQRIDSVITMPELTGSKPEVTHSLS